MNLFHDLGAGVAHLLRVLVSALETPVIVLLFAATAIAVYELGLAAGERWRGLATLRDQGNAKLAEDIAKTRIARADTLARSGPMLGLMGTLIPLGPGLAALGRGNTAELAASVTVAFDTTVLGLLVGLIGFALGKVRRRWYERLLDALEDTAMAGTASDASSATCDVTAEASGA